MKSELASAIVTLVEALLLQDLTTINAATSIDIIQPSYGWLDLGELEDVVLYTDCRQASSALLTFETAAAPVDSAFVALLPQFTLSAGLRTDKVFSSFAGVPVSRYLRWHLTPSPGSPGNAMFRIWVAAYGWS